MKRTRRKLNSRGILLIIIMLIIILLVGFSLLLKKKSCFYDKILAKKNSFIYEKIDGKYKKIGKINFDVNMKLENKNYKKNNKYFKILNTNYYLHYKDCNKKAKIDNYKIPKYYVTSNKVVADDKVNLYLNNKKVISINHNFSKNVLYSDSNYYYIEFAGNIYGIKKDFVTLSDKKNSDKISDYISIVHYKNISNSKCDDECVSVSDIETQLKDLKDNGYYNIKKSDYIMWNKNYLDVKEKAILFVVDDDKLIKSLFKKYGYSYIIEKNLEKIKLSDSNRSTSKSDSIDNLDSYLVTESNSKDIIKNIKEGTDYVVVTDPAEAIAVLNYHFFYDSSKGQSCGESICLEASAFEEQLEYLEKNDYKTLTIDEFKKWIYGELELPKKSVLLTVDDGAKGTGVNNGNVLIPLLEKHKMHATLFLISGWWSPDNYRSKYLDIQSHTSDMHRENYCTGEMRGSQLLCSTYEEILDDLTNSLNDVDSDTAFCFPYYSYNDKALKAVKEKGFKIAFVGGEKKATKNSNKYLIPRYVVYDGMPLSEFAKDIE